MTEPPPPGGPARGAFFGRRKGRPLRTGQAEAVASGLPRFGLPLDRPPPDPLGALFAGRPSAVRLEIGFGGGEHLVHRAAESPEIGFIGVEPFENGMAKALAALAARDLANVRVSPADAVHVLDWLPAGSIERVSLLYPDPWPKARHHKRRFVSPANLDRIARVLRPGGLFHFASDIDGYVDWTLQRVRRHGAFRWTAVRPADWTTPFPGWPGTRYEAKALREGRVGTYLAFERLAGDLPGAT